MARGSEGHEKREPGFAREENVVLKSNTLNTKDTKDSTDAAVSFESFVPFVFDSFPLGWLRYDTLAASSTSGSIFAASSTWSVEHEYAKRICPAPAAPNADPGDEPMPALSIR